MKYMYGFSVWPNERWEFNAAVFELFRHLITRVEMEFTEEEFDKFKRGLSDHGLTLREVERVPYHKPETVL